MRIADNSRYEWHTTSSVYSSGWRHLSGVLTGTLAAATRANSAGNEPLNVFVRGLENSLWAMHTLP